MGYIAKGSITLDTVNDAYTVSLTKQSCVIHADFDGSNLQLDDAFTIITVTRGEKHIAFDCSQVEEENCPSVQITDMSRGNGQSWKVKFIDISKDSLEGSVGLSIRTIDGWNTSIRFAYTVVRDSTMLDWVLDWEGSKTKIGDTYIMAPKIFIGQKEDYVDYADGGSNQVDNIMTISNLTGVYIGPDNQSAGLYGYKSNKEIFHLNQYGGMIGGWTINSEGMISPDQSLQILSSGAIQAIGSSGDVHWAVNSDGSATFSQGNVKFFNNGNAEFTGKIVSDSGNLAGWDITGNQIIKDGIGMDSYDHSIGIMRNAVISDDTSSPIHLLSSVRRSGGVAMYYTSVVDYGLVGYKHLDGTQSSVAVKVFSLGATNQIAGWNFDNAAIWSGTKNDTIGAYTTDGITMSVNGIRGKHWCIDANGNCKFMNGRIKFSDTNDGGEIVGWKLNSNRFSNSRAAIVSTDTEAGIFLSGKAESDFNSLASSSLTEYIDSWGGIYMKVKSDGVSMAGYNKDGCKLFKLRSNGVSSIAGWNFNSTTLYTGQAAINEGFANIDEITIGPDGIRGHKWRFEKDGAGSIAGGNISWNAQGELFFSDSVAMNWWGQGIKDAQDSAVISAKLAQVSQMIAFSQMLHRDPEFIKDKKNESKLYLYAAVNHCTFPATHVFSTMRDHGMLLQGCATIKKVELLHSDQTIEVVFEGSLNVYTIQPEQTVDVCGRIPNIVETDIIRVTFTGEDSWLQIEEYHNDSGETVFHKICGDSDIIGSQIITGSRKLVDDEHAPNSTHKVVEFTNKRWNSSTDFRLGGFYFADPSRANAKFVVKIVAKIPKDWMIENYHNSHGTEAKQEWITSQLGTGEYETYICLVTCGSTGVFQTINHFALRLDSSRYRPIANNTEYESGIKYESKDDSLYSVNEQVQWYVAYATVYDVTSSDKTTTTIDKHGIYTGTLRADQIISGTIRSSLINTDEILSNGNAWALKNDGSGYLANGNIRWGGDGNETEFRGRVTAIAGSFGGQKNGVTIKLDADSCALSMTVPDNVISDIDFTPRPDSKPYEALSIGKLFNVTASYDNDGHCQDATIAPRITLRHPTWFSGSIVGDQTVTIDSWNGIVHESEITLANGKSAKGVVAFGVSGAILPSQIMFDNLPGSREVCAKFQVYIDGEYLKVRTK